MTRGIHRRVRRDACDKWHGAGSGGLARSRRLSRWNRWRRFLGEFVILARSDAIQLFPLGIRLVLGFLDDPLKYLLEHSAADNRAPQLTPLLPAMENGLSCFTSLLITSRRILIYLVPYTFHVEKTLVEDGVVVFNAKAVWLYISL